MDIYHLGHASFLIKGKTGRLVIDPFDPDMLGIKFPKKTAADIIIISHDHPDHNFPQSVDTSEVTPVIFKGPGEYESHDIEITGIESYHDTNNGQDRGKNTLYTIYMDGLLIAHLGDIGHVLTEEQEEKLGDVDILMVPVGGHYTIDAQNAHKIVSQLEPSIVIPMHYQVSGLSKEIFTELSPVSEFLKVMGKSDIQPQNKLTVTRDKLPEETQVVVLE